MFVLFLFFLSVQTTDASSLCCKLSSNGSLTLGAGHIILNRNMQVIPFSGMTGKLSLFRIWGHERTKQEMKLLNCSEGDLVMWEEDLWDTWSCNPIADFSLKCGKFAFFQL